MSFLGNKICAWYFWPAAGKWDVFSGKFSPLVFSNSIFSLATDEEALPAEGRLGKTLSYTLSARNVGAQLRYAYEV